MRPGWLRGIHPIGSLGDDFKSSVERSGLVNHCPDRTVLFLRQTNCFFDGRRGDVKAADDVMNANSRKHLGRPFGLIGFHTHFVPGDFLVLFLAQNRDHVKGRATGESGRDQFDGLGPGSSGAVINQKIVFAARPRNELSLLGQWLCQFDFCRNHGILPWLLCGAHE